ncbi:MAG TPA: thioredoxin domain-containing protein, partial [Thermomicrobiales bacterium]|nr:thioredoxin domain-containing protein [Thermomicrobiales bacterium]
MPGAFSTIQKASPILPNHLANATSPYLRQHKDNPVEWYPWGPEALQKAQRENKPILVSIGYSACHWCHVMAHESFENEETAALMNEKFVNIKVDREERPDLDSIYMSAVQAMTGHGGWPLNCFLTPDGAPFFGGTYWPAEERSGLPSFRDVLNAVSEAYQNRRDDVQANADQLRTYLQEAAAATKKTGELSREIIDEALRNLGRAFDPRNGGFGGAPKFPQPSIIEFLLRTHRDSGDERAAAMARLTLDRMAEGGIYDQLGGGFHRYAVDAIWLVPHFEKMLYDNAQLARVYLDAYRAFDDATYRRVATETLDYVVREMTSPEGGFYSAQDADSEGEEGKFYVWTKEEIDQALKPEDAEIFEHFYGVTEEGNFEGRTILHTGEPLAQVASELDQSPKQIEKALDRARKKLLKVRDKRVHPGRDEKILLNWNGLMLRAFAEASRVLERPDYREVAEKNADFLLTKLTSDGELCHSYMEGVAAVPAFLDDYANLIDGLIALYEATFTPRWINEALRLTAIMIDQFSDPDG